MAKNKKKIAPSQHVRPHSTAALNKPTISIKDLNSDFDIVFAIELKKAFNEYFEEEIEKYKGLKIRIVK